VTVALLAVVSTAAGPACSFCGTDPAGASHTFDLTSLPAQTFVLNDSRPLVGLQYQVTSPCGCVLGKSAAMGPNGTCGCTPMIFDTRGCGSLAANVTVRGAGPSGFTLTVSGGYINPPLPRGRNAVYHFVCDRTVGLDNGPDPVATEGPTGFYNVVWRTPAACISYNKTKCAPPPTAPPAPPGPCIQPAPCMLGSTDCLPSWKPTWHMRNSTVLYTCNNTGMHNVTHANQFGVVVYDWSNAKAIWANAHPMSSQELITKQAEMVYAQDPGLPGYVPRVWAYRNTIKALNWYSSVREKLDDPKYASWFIRFNGFGE
jgi:hypothetical protein